MTPTMNILDLNDDCCYSLLKQLEIIDLYHMACSCERFAHIVTHLNPKYRINLKHIMTKEPNIDLCHFFMTIGHTIKSVKITKYKSQRNPITNDRLLQLIDSNCMNLACLRIKELEFYNLNVSILYRLINRLKVFEMKNTTIPPTFAFNINNYIDYNNNNQLFEYNFNRNDLQAITIENCKNFCPYLLGDILKESKNLKEIQLINQLINFPIDSTSHWTNSLQQIEFICLDGESARSLRLAALPKLSNLRRLHLIGFRYELDNLLLQLSNVDNLLELDLESCQLNAQNYLCLKKFTKLETLKLNKNFSMSNENLMDLCLNSQLKEFCAFDCLRISDDGIIRFFEMNRHVESIDVSWCWMITNLTINSIIDIIERQSLRPKLEIIAKGRTQINAHLLQDEILKKTNKFKLTVNSPDHPVNISLDFKERTRRGTPRIPISM